MNARERAIRILRREHRPELLERVQEQEAAARKKAEVWWLGWEMGKQAL